MCSAPIKLDSEEANSVKNVMTMPRMLYSAYSLEEQQQEEANYLCLTSRITTNAALSRFHMLSAPVGTAKYSSIHHQGKRPNSHHFDFAPKLH